MEKNKNKKTRCGFAAIVGRPNVGKSTLLNTIVGEKVAIVSKVPQTTRNQIRGIFTDERGQIIFIDTPGIHLGKDKLDQFMTDAAVGTFHDVDCIIHLVDTTRRIGQEEETVVSRLQNIDKPIILGLNKVDVKGPYIDEYIKMWEKARGKSIPEMKDFTLVALSGQKSVNVDKLLETVFEYMPEGPALYPEDTICDVPQRMALSDIIREKLFRTMQDEIPHSIGVVIERLDKSKELTSIKALILVERESQKEIVIGKGGAVLKNIGTQARKELEDLLETKVFLDLYVKTEKHWRDDSSLLQDLGYFLQ